MIACVDGTRDLAAKKFGLESAARIEGFVVDPTAMSVLGRNTNFWARSATTLAGVAPGKSIS
jgi:hypothetical protein